MNTKTMHLLVLWHFLAVSGRKVSTIQQTMVVQPPRPTCSRAQSGGILRKRQETPNIDYTRTLPDFQKANPFLVVTGGKFSTKPNHGHATTKNHVISHARSTGTQYTGSNCQGNDLNAHLATHSDNWAKIVIFGVEMATNNDHKGKIRAFPGEKSIGTQDMIPNALK